MATWELLLALLIAANALDAQIATESDDDAQVQDVNCNEPGPNKRGCCNMPPPKFDGFAACEQYTSAMLEGRKGKGNIFCAVNCIMTSTGALENDRLNQNNLRATLNQIYDNDEVMVDAYSQALLQCEITQQQKMDKAEGWSGGWSGARGGGRGGGRDGPPSGEQCPMFAFKLVMCAEKAVYMNCPTRYWTATTECEATKEYERVCGSHRRRGGGGGGNRMRGNRRGGR